MDGQEDVFSSSFAAASYLNAVNFPKEKKVYIVGEQGIAEELEAVRPPCVYVPYLSRLGRLQMEWRRGTLLCYTDRSSLMLVITA